MKHTMSVVAVALVLQASSAVAQPAGAKPDTAGRFSTLLRLHPSPMPPARPEPGRARGSNEELIFGACPTS